MNVPPCTDELVPCVCRGLGFPLPDHPSFLSLPPESHVQSIPGISFLLVASSLISLSPVGHMAADVCRALSLFAAKVSPH
jgi:hypothetical protein